MAIGEAEAFSERMKRELVALESANVYALMETETVVEEVGNNPTISVLCQMQCHFGGNQLQNYYSCFYVRYQCNSSPFALLNIVSISFCAFFCILHYDGHTQKCLLIEHSFASLLAPC